MPTDDDGVILLFGTHPYYALETGVLYPLSTVMLNEKAGKAPVIMILLGFDCLCLALFDSQRCHPGLLIRRIRIGIRLRLLAQQKTTLFFLQIPHRNR